MSTKNHTIDFRMKQYLKSNGLSMGVCTKLLQLNSKERFSKCFTTQYHMQLLASTFPDLNIEWLINGTGEMLNPVNYDNNKKKTYDLDHHYKRINRLNVAINYLESTGEYKVISVVAVLRNKTDMNSRTIDRALKGNLDYLTNRFLNKFNNCFGNVFSMDYLLRGEGTLLQTSDTQVTTWKEILTYLQKHHYLDHKDTDRHILLLHSDSYTEKQIAKIKELLYRNEKLLSAKDKWLINSIKKKTIHSFGLDMSCLTMPSLLKNEETCHLPLWNNNEEGNLSHGPLYTLNLQEDLKGYSVETLMVIYRYTALKLFVALKVSNNNDVIDNLKERLSKVQSLLEYYKKEDCDFKDIYWQDITSIHIRENNNSYSKIKKVIPNLSSRWMKYNKGFILNSRSL